MAQKVIRLVTPTVLKHRQLWIHGHGLSGNLINPSLPHQSGVIHQPGRWRFVSSPLEQMKGLVVLNPNSPQWLEADYIREVAPHMQFTLVIRPNHLWLLRGQDLSDQLLPPELRPLYRLTRPGDTLGCYLHSEGLNQAYQTVLQTPLSDLSEMDECRVEAFS